MENEHELSYETLTRVYLGSYEHYKGVVAEVEHSKPGFELQGSKMGFASRPSLMIQGSYGSKGLLPYRCGGLETDGGGFGSVVFRGLIGAKRRSCAFNFDQENVQAGG
ncbi:hypothetical protein Tco_0527740 [Tanacetum coccineum]